MFNRGNAVDYSQANLNPEEGWNPWTAAFSTTVILLADDVTGIGVVDDIAIPVILAGASSYDVTQRTFVTYTMRNPTGQVYV